MNITFPYLEPWQADVFKFSSLPENQNDKWVVIKSVRQCGKSILAQLLLIYSSLQKGNSVSISVSPVMSQSRKMFSDVERIARPLLKHSNASLLELRLQNDSKILFKSAEQGDTIRGETIKGTGILVVDEAAYISDDVFYNILVPTTNVYKSNIYIFSTPKFQQGFFYQLYTRGLHNDPKVKSFDWTQYDTSKYLSIETLELYRKSMPKIAFEAEYLGQFITGQGSVFSNFRECISDVPLKPRYQVWIGIDWGTGSGADYTVLTVGQFNSEINKTVISEQIAFNDKNVQDTIKEILKVVKKLARCCKEIGIIVEKNSIGNVYYQLLVDALDTFERDFNYNASIRDEIRIDCITFTTSNRSKERIIKNLVVLFEQQQIVLPEIEELFLELAAYECTISSTGAPIYNGKGRHDDRVMSLAILCDKI